MVQQYIINQSQLLKVNWQTKYSQLSCRPCLVQWTFLEVDRCISSWYRYNTQQTVQCKRYKLSYSIFFVKHSICIDSLQKSDVAVPSVHTFYFKGHLCTSDGRFAREENDSIWFDGKFDSIWFDTANQLTFSLICYGSPYPLWPSHLLTYKTGNTYANMEINDIAEHYTKQGEMEGLSPHN